MLKLKYGYQYQVLYIRTYIIILFRYLSVRVRKISIPFTSIFFRYKTKPKLLYILYGFYEFIDYSKGCVCKIVLVQSGHENIQ